MQRLSAFGADRLGGWLLHFGVLAPLAVLGAVVVDRAGSDLRAAERSVDRTRAEVLVDVADDGKGIPPEAVARIYDPFFTTKSKETGTGLGLANSYSIVEQHDGSITVESTPGEGSSFTLTLIFEPELPRQKAA